jgi:pimeloyl-ACP methyl ester carboxylesterase
VKALLRASILSLCYLASAPCAEVSPGEKQLPLPGESLVFDGHEAFLILPEKTAAGSPWVWYAPTLKGLPSKEEVWMFKQFLAKGIAIAGIDIGESYGSPAGRKIFSDYHAYLTGERDFSKKPVLLARSRGGLMLYGWAAENPQSVAAIAGIYPVCNIASYPGLARAAGAYKLTAAELESKLDEHNPIARMAPLAEAKIPLRHIHGDNDKVVPLDANSGELVKRYKALGGPAELEVVPGGGHDGDRAWFQSQPLTDFIITHALRAAAEK